MMPSARSVFEHPEAHWPFLTQPVDDLFEGQHFDRKQVGQTEATGSDLKNQVDRVRGQVTETVSAFANQNVEGGLLVLGISSNGEVLGIDHLSEKQKNSLTDISSFLHHQAAEVKFYGCLDRNGSAKTLCLIFTPYTANAICETPGGNPKGWTRQGPQNIPLSQARRDQLKAAKRILDFEGTACCEFSAADVAEDVLTEFRRVFRAESINSFGVERLLYEAGALTRADGRYWFTYAGLLFFGSNPQRVLPRALIRVLRFGVHSEQFRERGLPTFDQQFTGPLTKQIREARTFFRESAFFKRYQKRRLEGGFIDEPELPSTVIDEAIVNAVAHRDYRTGVPIECESYSDAFLVKNPGRIIQRNCDLADEFSLADTALDSMPRNPRLLEWLKLMKDPQGSAYVQAVSEGTKQMVTEMAALGLPAPRYRLQENETLIRLESKSAEREAAIQAGSRTPSTEFGNLFPLRFRRNETPVSHEVAAARYPELCTSLRDKLAADGWFIDRFSFSRILVHRKGVALDAPSDVQRVLRFYPAYELQVREYFGRYYLCVDYKCEVRNVQTLAALSGMLAATSLVNRRCLAKLGDWRDGKIVELSLQFARVRFSDTDHEEQVPSDLVVPTCSVALLDEILIRSKIRFDLASAIKRHSLASKPGAARERFEQVAQMVRHLAETVFPLQLSDLAADLSPQPVQLADHGPTSEAVFLVRRLAEPNVEFRSQAMSSDVRVGITQFGTYDASQHSIEIVPVCLDSARRKMEALIERLKHGKYKYRGAERTFMTRLSYSGVVTADSAEKLTPEIARVLGEHPEWETGPELNRIFLVQAPEAGYRLDDHNSPYYASKRLLLERGLPCQMVDTPTLDDPDWKDLNLALNMTAKCGVTPWVLPDAIPDADFFVGLSHTQAGDGQRIMGFANVFNSYGKWEFYSGNTAYFDYEERSLNLAKLVGETLQKLHSQLSPTPRIVFHHSAKLARADRDSILAAAREVRPSGTFSFAWINSHHNIRWYDSRPETDGSLRRGSYVEAAWNRLYLSTTGYNPFRRALGTPKPLEITSWVERPPGMPPAAPDLRALAVQVLNLTKLNWSSTDSFCGEPITLKYAGDIAYLTAAFLRQSEPFRLHPALEKTPWFI